MTLTHHFRPFPRHEQRIDPGLLQMGIGPAQGVDDLRARGDDDDGTQSPFAFSIFFFAFVSLEKRGFRIESRLECRPRGPR